MARQEARGKSEEGLGGFTSLYTVWFYCVHLLTFLHIPLNFSVHLLTYLIFDSLRGVAIQNSVHLHILKSSCLPTQENSQNQTGVL